MNRIVLFCLVVSALIVWGCGAAVPSEPVSSIDEEIVLREGIEVGNPDSTHESNTGETVILVQGKLDVTKGAQGMLDGHLISREQLAQYFSNADGEVLFGTSFSVEAIRHVRTCHPMEQCLQSGRIPSLKYIQTVEPSYGGAACPENIKEGHSCIDEANICILDGGEYDSSRGEICGESTHLECNSKIWQIMTEANVCLLN